MALAAGATAGGLIGSMNPTSVGTATAVSKTVLSTSQIASRVAPGLVDVVSTDGDQQATSAGTGIVVKVDSGASRNELTRCERLSKPAYRWRKRSQNPFLIALRASSEESRALS